MNQFDNTKKVTKRRISENDDVIADIDSFMKYINVLED